MQWVRAMGRQGKGEGMGITVNDMRNGVVGALQTQFPDDTVYGETTTGATAPYFFVKLAKFGQTQLLNDRYRRTGSFDIQYVPGDGQGYDAMHDVAEALYEGMRLIAMDGNSCRGTQMSHEIVDGVLHFYADYALTVRHEGSAATAMQELEQKEGTP